MFFPFPLVLSSPAAVPSRSLAEENGVLKCLSSLLILTQALYRCTEGKNDIQVEGLTQPNAGGPHFEKIP